MRSEILLLFPLAASIGLAQPPQPQTHHETIVVTGTFEPLSLDEIDRAIRVLPARDNALVVNTLVDLLRLDPSLDLQARAPDGVQTDLSIRGSSFGQTLVLLNGQRLNDVQSGHHNMDIPVPLDSVSRVEVLLGSGSTMYGSDAAGGVINIITEPPAGMELRLRAAAGNYGINQQRGSIAGSFGKLSEQLSFSRDFSTGFIPDRDYRSLELASSTHLATALGATSLTLAYMDHPFGADQFYGNFNSWENTKTWFAGVQQALGADTTASFSFRRHSDLFVLFRDRPEVFTNHHSDESEQADLRRRQAISTATTVSYGVEALHESILSNNLGEHSRSRGAAYAALDFRALRRFSLSLSAREEVYRSFSGQFSPTVAGGFWLSQRWKFRASASRAFRVPSYTDLYYHDPANLGSPDLRPERAWTYEGGLDWNPGGRVRGAVTIFKRRERDGIDYYRSSPTDVWRALNIQNLDFTGVEASLRLVPARGQSLDLRYTGLRGAQDTVPVGFTKYTFNYPTHSGVVAWQASLRRDVVVRSRVGVLDRRARDPYALWDLYAAVTPGRVHPFLQVSNVTSTRYQEILGVGMPGRTVIGGIELVVGH
ncbi:MAG: TonB-dependent receptor [Acidobacteriia bacterium]|nr:TonB-dependent receptor [Terriglobia bacterium]